MARPASLSLTMPKTTSAVSSTVASPTYAGSSTSSLGLAQSVHNEKWKSLESRRQAFNNDQQPPSSPEITSLPPFPSSPRDAPKHTREPSKGFFSNLKASKSSNKVYQIEPTIRQVSEDIPRGKADSKENTIYSVRRSPGSTPDLNSCTTLDTDSMEEQRSVGRQGRVQGQGQGNIVPRRPIGTSVASDSMIVTSPVETSHSKKPKPRLANLLSRSRSTHMDESGRKSKSPTPIQTMSGPDIRIQTHGLGIEEDREVSPRTAPIRRENPYRELIGSNRNRSAERQNPSKIGQENVPLRRGEKVSTSGLSATPAGGLREAGGSHLFMNIKNTSSKAADGLGKAGKSIFSKVSKSNSSTTTKEEERYTPRVINLPLVAQTRKTRIARKLEGSKDKTEFWMPALPWRCIDFLNDRGPESEGLYRVPGSELQIRQWQKRFDQELDINLFDVPDLYDVNIIGSMFKTWLRDLPTEILPKTIQAKIARECMGATECPQLLKDELSLLPPWNYYLLFAITCHLSLLLTYEKTNKMNFKNLCICFQHSLRIDTFCFQFLVQDWQHCWRQGCWTEKEALAEEYRMIDRELHGNGDDGDDDIPQDFEVFTEDCPENPSSSFPAVTETRSLTPSGSQYNTMDERSLTSSGSGQLPFRGRGQQEPQHIPLTVNHPRNEHLSTIYSESSSTPTNAEFQEHQNDSSDTVNLYRDESTSRTPLPKLAPMTPVSPITHHFHSRSQSRSS